MLKYSLKTDQFRDGARVEIACTHTQLCPVIMLERYVKMADIQGDVHKHLFRGLVVTKAGAKLRATGGLSYTRVRELVLEKLSKIGLDASKFGLHSLRAGGASAAGGSRGMGDGGVRMLKMAMLKIAWRTDSRFLVTWDFRVPIVVVQLSLLSSRQLHGHPI